MNRKRALALSAISFFFSYLSFEPASRADLHSYFGIGYADEVGVDRQDAALVTVRLVQLSEKDDFSHFQIEATFDPENLDYVDIELVGPGKLPVRPESGGLFSEVNLYGGVFEHTEDQAIGLDQASSLSIGRLEVLLGSLSDDTTAMVRLLVDTLGFSSVERKKDGETFTGLSTSVGAWLSIGTGPIAFNIGTKTRFFTQDFLSELGARIDEVEASLEFIPVDSFLKFMLKYARSEFQYSETGVLESNERVDRIMLSVEYSPGEKDKRTRAQKYFNFQ